MCVTPDSGRTVWGFSGLQQSPAELQGMGSDDIVVGESMDQQQRRQFLLAECSGISAQIGDLIVPGLVVGVPEVTLGVVRVVEAPVGDGGASDGSVEDVGAAQHGEGGEVPAERPPPDGDPAEVEERMADGEVVQRIDLVGEDGSGQIAPHRPLEGRIATRRAARR